MRDISDGGAKVILDRSVHLPETFTLWLMDNGSVYRECKIVWRVEHVLGVRFCHARDTYHAISTRTGFRFTG